MHAQKTHSWSEKYATGIRAIDNDHKGLFEDIRFLGEALVSDAEPRQIAHSIGGLEEYCREHFAREETFMSSAHYPHVATHIREHRRISRHVAQLRALYQENPKQIDGAKVFRFLTDWLSSHILGSDMRYIPYLRGEKHGGESDSQDLREVSIKVSQSQAKVVADFVKIIDSDHPVAQELGLAIRQFERRLEKEERETARQLFCKA